MTIEQLRARVSALESAIDRTKVESAQATQQLEVETDEGTVLSLWSRITARRNAGKTLEQQLAAARQELTEAEQAAALVHYQQAQAAAMRAYDELRKSAAQTLAKAEAAAAAIDAMVAAQRGTGQKYQHIPGVGRYGADPYAVLCDAMGFEIRGTWDTFSVMRPAKDMPQSPNPFTLGLGTGK